MTTLSCEVVRDLLPTYVEGLTSNETNALVEEHVEGCAACRSMLETMRADMGSSTLPGEDDQHEIDFLRRNRRRNSRIILTSIVGALAAILVVLAANLYVIGSNTAPGSLASAATVEGTHLALDLTPIDSASGIARVSLEEHDGVVSVRTRSVLASPLHPGSHQASFDATAPITQVKVDGRIVWADGSEVSPLAATVFDTRHDYVGDMSANGRTVGALGVSNYLGAMQHELQTDQEPYGWTIHLQQDLASTRIGLMESDMRAFAYVLLGLVGNLDEVTYRYTVDGQEQSLSVTTEDATGFFGQNIKDCGGSVRLLDELLDKTGITAMTIG